ncbi:hypothetical protein HAX54_044593 [Datura stramonium]|uniref:Uncharacterized protein n=1 Tax=Datura stramonium TaxID=4076 RepID=A0ABS8SPR9_DATST|nr:hypothetical protein [Datura stramonium]
MSGISSTSELMEHLLSDRPSLAPSSNQFDEGDDSLVDGYSSSGNDSESNERSGIEATNSLTRDSEPMKGDVLKGLTTTARGHLKCSLVEEVRIIDSEFPEYPEVEAKYKFYGLGWMSEAPGYYYAIMVREFYLNYIATLEGM